MSAVPTTISFLCSAILGVFVAVRRVRENVAKLALVAWLLGSNMVHGINAAIWYSNSDPKALGWCDLTANMVLATTIAISGACLCISRHLEMVSSSRSLPSSAKAHRNRRLLDAIFCYLIPLIYIPYHIIGQDYRFDLVKGIGCMASVHPSVPASMVVWIPHILICILSLGLSGIAINNSLRHPATHFSTYLESRSSMSSREWSRTLALSTAIPAVTLIVLLFSMFSTPMSDSWTSWQHVHQNLSQVNIVDDADQVLGVKAAWWGLRVITLVYIVLALVLAEESRDIFRYIGDLKKPYLRLRALITPRHQGRDKHSSYLPSFDKPARPLTLELRSGWDDDLDLKTSRLSPKGWKRSKYSPPASPSPTPSSSKVMDDVYVTSSMPYLNSAMAKPLGFNSLALPPSPPPVYQSSRQDPKSLTDYFSSRDSCSSLVIPTAPTPTRPLAIKKHHPVESRGSNIIAMLQDQWPTPPISIPSPVPSPIPSPIPEDMITDTMEEISPTRASSPALSIDERREPCSYLPSSTPHRLFANSCASSSSSSTSQGKLLHDQQRGF